MIKCLNCVHPEPEFLILPLDGGRCEKIDLGPLTVITANPGSGPAQAPESSIFGGLRSTWTPVFTGVTYFSKKAYYKEGG